MTRSPRPIALAAVVVLAASACSGGAVATPPSVSGPVDSFTPDTSAGCEPAPQPTDLTGWDVSSQSPSVIPQIVLDATCGENRFMFGFTDAATNAPVGAPDQPASVAFFDLGSSLDEPVSSAEGEFVWAIEGSRGIYIAHPSFDRAGVWGAEFTYGSGDAEETVRTIFTVRATLPTIQIGQAAPASDTPTVDDVGGDLSKISTDTEPVEAFYTTSIADAVAAHEPFVVIFATPKFCVTAQCGPTLEKAKPVARANPDVTFINVEPYQLEWTEGQLQPVLTETNGQNNLTPIQAVLDWGLQYEPWAFVVDADGVVRGSLGLTFSETELQDAIDTVTAAEVVPSASPSAGGASAQPVAAPDGSAGDAAPSGPAASSLPRR